MELALLYEDHERLRESQDASQLAVEASCSPENDVQAVVPTASPPASPESSTSTTDSSEVRMLCCQYILHRENMARKGK